MRSMADNLRAGARVRLHSLKAATQYNDAEGHLLDRLRPESENREQSQVICALVPVIQSMATAFAQSSPGRVRGSSQRQQPSRSLAATHCSPVLGFCSTPSLSLRGISLNDVLRVLRGSLRPQKPFCGPNRHEHKHELTYVHCPNYGSA